MVDLVDLVDAMLAALLAGALLGMCRRTGCVSSQIQLHCHNQSISFCILYCP